LRRFSTAFKTACCSPDHGKNPIQMVLDRDLLFRWNE
jgi:hypothetical protein